MKTCKSCEMEKPKEEFYPRKDARDGRRSICRGCSTLSVKKWKSDHKPLVRAQQAERQRRLRASNSLFRLKQNIRRAIRKGLNQVSATKSGTSQDILGCSYQDLECHLIGTALNNYGAWCEAENYHIDHIVPLATAVTAEDIYKLNHYSNLQLLLAADNMAKGAKVS